MKGVYLIINKSNNSVIYVGSSKNLERRLREHKNAITTRHFKDNENLYLFMSENETFFKIIESENYKDKEQELIQSLNPIFNSFNAKMPESYFKDYYKNNKEYFSERNKQYRESHADYCKKYNKNYREVHKAELEEYKDWYNNRLCFDCRPNSKKEFVNFNALRIWAKRNPSEIGNLTPIEYATKYLVKEANYESH